MSDIYLPIHFHFPASVISDEGVVKKFPGMLAAMFEWVQ